MTEKPVLRYTQKEAGYTDQPAETAATCANCRWLLKSVDHSGCAIVENFPLDVVEAGKCDKHEALPVEIKADTSNSFTVDPDSGATVTHTWNVKTTVAAADVDGARFVDLPDGATVIVHDHAHEQPETVYAAPDSNNPGVLKALVDRFTRGLKPGQTVFKAADGKRYMLIVTSNSYEDRDRETIKTAALQDYVDRSWKAEDLFISHNPQLFWHDDRLKMGDIVWADVRGPFLVELAQEAANPIAAKMYDYIEAHPDEKWGASHRFGYYKSDRDADGTYHRIFKQETTTLPRDAAANLLTFSGVLPVTDKKGEYLNKMLGLDNASDLLDKGIDVLVAELAKNGVSHKSTDAPETPTVEFSAVAKMLVDVVQDLAAMSEQLDAVQKEYAEKSAALDTERQTLATELKAIKAMQDQLQTHNSMAPRSASRATETEIEKSSSKIQQDQLDELEYEQDPHWGRVKRQR